MIQRVGGGRKIDHGPSSPYGSRLGSGASLSGVGIGNMTPFMTVGGLPDGYRNDGSVSKAIVINYERVMARLGEACPKGHQYTKQNMSIDSRGYVRCRVCKNAPHRKKDESE